MLATVFYRDRNRGTRDQDRIVHFRIDVGRVVGDGLPFAFSDGHGIMALTDFYDDPARFDRIDWAVIQGGSWFDTIEQPDRKRKKQAEFLVYKNLPVRYIEEIGVRTAAIRGEIAAMLAFQPALPPINLRPEWYYA